MNKKRMQVIGIALVLMALVAGMVFAGEEKISLRTSGNTVYVYNGNSQTYNVTVLIIYSANGVSGQRTSRSVTVRAGQEESARIGASAIIEHVEVTSASPGF
jgi:threonine synthase